MAGIGAMTLDSLLQKATSLTGLSNKFHDILAQRIYFPWQLARACDGKYEYTKDGGKHSFGLKFNGWFVEHLIHIAQKSDAVAAAFFECMNFVRSPFALFAPTIFGKVVLHSLFGHTNRPRK